MTVAEQYLALAAELEALGLRNGSDFVIDGVSTPGLIGSEFIGLRQLPDGRFEVASNDMGQRIVDLVTDDFERARAMIVSEAVALAKDHRRGPLATDPDPEIPWNEALGLATDPPADRSEQH